MNEKKYKEEINIRVNYGVMIISYKKKFFYYVWKIKDVE